MKNTIKKRIFKFKLKNKTSLGSKYARRKKKKYKLKKNQTRKKVGCKSCNGFRQMKKFIAIALI